MRRTLALCFLAAGCAVREEGIEVDVRVRVEPPLGVSLAVASLAVERLELVACPEARGWRWLTPVSSAWAHGSPSDASASPRVLEAPALIDLRTSEPQPLGALHPPPGRYCGLVVSFAPSSTDGPVAGASLYVAGTGLQQRSLRRETRTVSLSALPVDAQNLGGNLTLRLQPSVAGDADASLIATLDTLTLE